MYQATLFHPQGDSVTDFRDTKTKDDVWEAINNMGSRWIFYPLCFVTTEKTVVSTPDGLEFLEGKRIETVRSYLKKEWFNRTEEICQMINAGLPMELIYPQPD